MIKKFISFYHIIGEDNKMFYKDRLLFLCDIFKKYRIQVNIINPDKPIPRDIPFNFKNMLENTDNIASFSEAMRNIDTHIIYRLTDSFKLMYIYMLLPETAEKQLLLIGPYLNSAVEKIEILEIAEKHNIHPNKQSTLERMYEGVPVINDSSYLFAILNTFGEHIFGGADRFSIADLNHESLDDTLPLKQNETNDTSDQLINMKLMEQRYSYENEIMEAVSHGQIQKTDLLLPNLSKISFEHRLSDPIRNLKNYCIIMNTLLRKAAQNGGVHPLYLDNISSSFAAKIEIISSTKSGYSLMEEMFRSYCRLVKKHSMKDFSSPVQKAITCIDANLAGDISLSVLASTQNISAGYLSTLFKKETGKTVTEYINNSRVEYAKKLLGTTKLQIQTIAQHCGILDVHYFSKLFKKYTGKTPKEYRDSAKN